MPAAKSLESEVLEKLLPPALPRLFHGTLSRLLGLSKTARLYESIRTSDQLPERLTERLGVQYAIADRDIAHIPVKGPCVAVVNHPFGILDGAVLAALFQRIRPDVKFLANHVLTAIPEIRDLVIPVDPFGSHLNRSGVRKSLDFLEGGGMLIVFPAGEVSHFHWTTRSITDPDWSTGVVRLIAMAARRAIPTTLLPVYVAGANSTLFQIAGLVHPRLRTAMLARELLNKRGCKIEVRVGGTVDSRKLLAMPSDRERIDYLRWRTYLLAARRPFKARTSWPLAKRSKKQTAPIADPISASLMTREIASIRERYSLVESGEFEVFCAPAIAIPNVLREIGRLREITFRGAGEGTGEPLDLDLFDQHYLHLFVWNRDRQELVGAYRLAKSDCVGASGLYTATLFEYDCSFLDRFGPAIELGRSFVRSEYQKGFAPLLLLWKGIGKYVARNPRYKTLFGPVSVSNEYQSVSRRLMLSYLEREALLREWTRFIRPKNPPARSADNQLPCADLDELSSAVSDIEPSGAGVPVLLRQYLKLGGKLLGFNVDAKFSNTLDGLILVDLTKTEPKLLERYLGKQEAAKFLAFHQRSS